MKLCIDGYDVKDIDDFHDVFSKLLGIEPYYGRNCHALRDVLRTGVDRPCHLEWTNSAVSRKNLGVDFELIIQIFEEIMRQDEEYGWLDKFTYALR